MNRNYKLPAYLTCMVLVALVVSASAQTAAPAATSAPAVATTDSNAAPQFTQHDPRYRLRESDVFDVSFELSPEMNQAAVVVQPDGFITLRGVGDVKVVGETIPELIDTLKLSYSKILHDPIISVVLRDFQKPFFVADGQLARPGKYELRGDVTLTEAIAMAGGFLDSAKHSQVVLYRRVDDKWSSARLFNIKEMEHNRNLAEDPYLRNGDMLFVPKNFMSKIKPFVPNSGVSVAAFNRQY